MGSAPADRAAAARVSVLTLRLTEDRITRWMLTLTTASVFDAAHNMTKVRHLRKVIRAAVLPQGEAEVVAADISEGAPFAIPNGQGAQAAQVRAALIPIRFFNLATIAVMERPGDTMPWNALAVLQGILGNIFTIAARTDELSNVQAMAAHFRHFHPECPSDATLARALRNIEGDTRLPISMEPVSTDADELFSAAIDGLDYQNPARKLQIEERRIRLLLDEVSLMLIYGSLLSHHDNASFLHQISPV